MENLVLQALGNDKVEKINKIKKNKEFLRRLIGDLQQVYTVLQIGLGFRRIEKIKLEI